MTESELKELAAAGIKAEITRLQGLLAQITGGATAKAGPHRPQSVVASAEGCPRTLVRRCGSRCKRGGAARAAGVTSLKAVKVKGGRKKR